MADLKRYAVEADIEAFDKYDILMKPDADGRWASWEEAASIIAELERQLADARELARCQVCGIKVFWWPRYSGDPEAYDMAHIKSRGAGGSDTLDNVRCLCHRCHMKEHGEGKKSA